MVAGPPLNPGMVPKMNWSFSPSALVIWLRLSSSIAMEDIIRLIASSRVSGGLIDGKLGCDIR
jgi:hypothetical protein